MKRNPIFMGHCSPLIFYKGRPRTKPLSQKGCSKLKEEVLLTVIGCVVKTFENMSISFVERGVLRRGSETTMSRKQ